MPLTLGSAFDASVEATRASVRALPALPPRGQVRTLIHQLTGLVAALRTAPDHFTRSTVRVPRPATVMGRTRAHLTPHLTAAEDRLKLALTRCAPLSSPGGAAGSHLAEARVRLRLAQEVLASHRGPDGEPLTPYLSLQTQAGAQRYVLLRITDLAWEAGRLAGHLAERTADPGVAELLAGARRALHQAVVLGRDAGRPVMPEYAELPTAPTPTVQPDGVRPLDLPQNSDRLIRAVFQATRADGRPLSGSDLHQIARHLTLVNLLTGRLLLHVSESADPAAGQRLGHTANALRESARQWGLVARAFARVVDLSDPRETPRLPRYTHHDVRSGRANPMPRTAPHPATETAWGLGVRVGQLLYGERWQPTDPRPLARPAADLLTDAGAGTPGGLLRVLHQPLAAARFLAHQAPRLLRRARPHLVSDAPEHRPVPSPTRTRWYPITARQLDGLCEVFHSAATAQERATTELERAARTLGTDLPRARLDSIVHALLSEAEHWTPPHVAGVTTPATTHGRITSRDPQYRLPPVRPDLEMQLADAYGDDDRRTEERPRALAPRVREPRI
ncbi:hypothetical protein [Streptomyces sedi]|uniref:Uncharacterized protein n=1 Tax=Streptomyces sedi TaxID=555059 RepID=A0A5C4URG7_9ACTN|nr:hypothetical protein [Streptomyces sedi]TNM25893.1 hypothetical protein FH715_25330 [Streptomyces sedi]